MNVEMLARNIQVILAPVVMVTACAILVQGLLNRYAGINDRLRLLARERFDLLAAAAGATLRAERLRLIDAQVPTLLRHHTLLHHAILAVYSAILLFLGSMFAIAVAALDNSLEMTLLVLGLFLGGTGGLVLGVLLTALEVRTSHHAVHYEVRQVLALDLTPPSDAGPRSTS